MDVILTNVSEPLINHEDIIVKKLKLSQATYQWKSQPNVLRKIEIGNANFSNQLRSFQYLAQQEFRWSRDSESKL